MAPSIGHARLRIRVKRPSRPRCRTCGGRSDSLFVIRTHVLIAARQRGGGITSVKPAVRASFAMSGCLFLVERHFEQVAQRFRYWRDHRLPATPVLDPLT